MADVRLDVEAEGAQALALFRRVESALTAVEKRIDGTARASRRQARATQQATQQFSIYAKVAIAIAAIRRAQTVVGTITEINTRIVELGEATGISIPVLQALTRVLQEDGISADQFNKSVRRVFISIGEARRGVRRKIDSLTELGITYRDLIELAPDELFFRISAGLADLPDDYARATVGADLFGARNSQIATTLARYGDNLEEASARQTRFGLVTSDNAIRLKALDQTLTDVGNRLESTLGNEIGRLADDIGQIADTFSEDLNAGIRASIRLLEDVLGSFEDTEEGIKAVQDVIFTLGGAASIAAIVRFGRSIRQARGQLALFAAAAFVVQEAASGILRGRADLNEAIEENLSATIDRDIFSNDITNLESIAAAIGISTSELERVRNDIIKDINRSVNELINLSGREGQGLASLQVNIADEVSRNLREWVEARREIFQLFSEIPAFAESFNNPDQSVTSTAENIFRDLTARLDELVRRGADPSEYENIIRLARIAAQTQERNAEIQERILRQSREEIFAREDAAAVLLAIEENRAQVVDEINRARQEDIDTVERETRSLADQLEILGLTNREQRERSAIQEARIALLDRIKSEQEDLRELAQDIAEAQAEEDAAAGSEALVAPLREERRELEAIAALKAAALEQLQARLRELGVEDRLVQSILEREQRRAALERREDQPGINLEVFNTLADADREVADTERDLLRAREDAINNLVRQTQTAQERIDELTLSSDQAIDRAVDRAVGQQREQEILDISRSLIDARVNLIDLYQRYAAAVQSGDEAAIQSAGREFAAAGRTLNRLTELFDLVESGAVSYQEYADAVREVLLTQRELDAEELANAQRIDAINRRLDLLKSVAEGVAGSLADLFSKAFDEGEKFNDLLEDIGRNLSRLLINQAFSAFLEGIFPALYNRNPQIVQVLPGGPTPVPTGDSGLPSIGTGPGTQVVNQFSFSFAPGTDAAHLRQVVREEIPNLIRAVQNNQFYGILDRSSATYQELSVT